MLLEGGRETGGKEDSPGDPGPGRGVEGQVPPAERQEGDQVLEPGRDVGPDGPRGATGQEGAGREPPADMQDPADAQEGGGG